ncbi:hypothetical protein GCM10009647_066510 [Streptomyces sanglieri]
MVIAQELRVSGRSVERWRRARREGGPQAPRSARPVKVPRISDAQFAVLEEELGKGPAARGLECRWWTSSRVQAVIDRRFRVTVSVTIVWRLPKRPGWSW